MGLFDSFKNIFKKSDDLEKTIDKLLNNFETEMNILHKLSEDDIEAVVGEKVAKMIIAAREGKANIQAGGGGVYGKLTVG